MPNPQPPADHETAAPESGDRAMPTNAKSKSAANPPKVDAPADHETASPESGDRAMPTGEKHARHPI